MKSQYVEINITQKEGTVESPKYVCEPAIINRGSQQDVYIFVHAIGSNYYDLRPLIAEYANNGETCVVIRYSDRFVV